MRNCTVSAGCSLPGLTRVRLKVGRNILSCGLPSWYKGYLNKYGNDIKLHERKLPFHLFIFQDIIIELS